LKPQAESYCPFGAAYRPPYIGAHGQPVNPLMPSA
jgi:hypothetical protein